MITKLSSRTHHLKLTIEPWGDEYKVPEKTKVDVFSNQKNAGKIEVEVGDGFVVVHGWGNDMWVCCGGEKIEPFTD